MVSNLRGKLGMDGISKPHDYKAIHDSNAISEGPKTLGSLSRYSTGIFQTNLSYMGVWSSFSATSLNTSNSHRPTKVPSLEYEFWFMTPCLEWVLIPSRIHVNASICHWSLNILRSHPPSHPVLWPFIRVNNFRMSTLGETWKMNDCDGSKDSFCESVSHVHDINSLWDLTKVTQPL